MTALLLVWLLFVLPPCLFGAGAALVLLGAHIYHAGQQGRSPSIRMPAFSLSRKSQNGKHEDREVSRLPDV